MKKLSGILVGLVAALLFSTDAGAYFERLGVSSRADAMGGAFASVADDPSAVVLNPAGLSQMRSPAVLSTVCEPYGIADLGEYFLSVAVPTRRVGLGFSWHHFGLDGVTSEDLFTVAAARNVVRTSQDASLSVGAGFDVARVSYSGEIDASATVLTGSLSVLLRPFPFFGAGYAVRNIGEPSFAFDLPAPYREGASGPGATRLEATHAFGFSYRRDEVFFVLYERQRGQDGRWRNRFGIEVGAGDHLRLRSGLRGRDVTGGLGVVWSNVAVDVGIASHGTLGLSYTVSAGISLPPGGSGKEE